MFFWQQVADSILAEELLVQVTGSENHMWCTCVLHSCRVEAGGTRLSPAASTARGRHQRCSATSSSNCAQFANVQHSCRCMPLTAMEHPLGGGADTHPAAEEQMLHLAAKIKRLCEYRELCLHTIMRTFAIVAALAATLQACHGLAFDLKASATRVCLPCELDRASLTHHHLYSACRKL